LLCFDSEDGYRGVPVSIKLYDGRKLDALALQGAGMAIQTPPGKFLLPSRRFVSLDFDLGFALHVILVLYFDHVFVFVVGICIH
jgi:hypothetical protein